MNVKELKEKLDEFSDNAIIIFRHRREKRNGIEDLIEDFLYDVILEKQNIIEKEIALCPEYDPNDPFRNEAYVLGQGTEDLEIKDFTISKCIVMGL